ncbi:MAG: hypothetical protein EPN98_21540 [Phenylobacterium sp.]|uniref:hypothetical protein n=1 Tax=Phenylobacterium sp. TaxID=1871053 RepID=UPI0011FBCC79|nr:hypothetical protein [Phenylobacterium sp.]TAL29028.1 MAG: hypothetical protein EPN98_21540 [Phenylobacterium sp.]
MANGAPVGALPADGDPPNAATFAQPYKVLLDWVAFNAKRSAVSIFGTGADGDVTISSGTTNLSASANYVNLTIGATGILVANSFLINVKGTLTVVSGGKIIDAAAAPKNGGDASGIGIGSAGLGGNGSSTGVYLGGASGANGAVTTVAGTPGDAVTFALGGAGGAGGAGNTGGAGGAAGAFTAPAAGTITDIARAFSQPGWVIERTGSAGARTGTLRGLMGGGSGGSGGGSPTHPGAGSGAGGGLVVIFAQHVVLATSSDIMAPGGDGGATPDGAFAAGGGGGAGGGGAVLLYYGTKSGPSLSAAACCPGGVGKGPGGTGSGSFFGAGGSVGHVFEFNVGY